MEGNDRLVNFEVIIAFNIVYNGERDFENFGSG